MPDLAWARGEPELAELVSRARWAIRITLGRAASGFNERRLPSRPTSLRTCTDAPSPFSGAGDLVFCTATGHTTGHPPT